jgi:hypothetical protein
VTPCADGGALVEMTVGEETMTRIRRLRELYADEVPDGDLGKILELALDALLQEVEAHARERPRGH